MSKITVTKALGAKFAGMRLRVGLFNVSDIAAYGAAHEFGAPSRNIPKRSFILTPVKRDLPEIAKKAKSINDIGVMLVAACQNEIRTEGQGQWQSFSENYKTRPSGKPVTEQSKLLRDTGALTKAIAFQAEGV